MTTLITGATGNTGSSLAKLLHDAGHPVITASRTGQAPTGTPYKAVLFDWYDAATHQNPFSLEGLEKPIERVYLIGPPGRPDAIPIVNGFIDFARSKGVKRFVLLSGTAIKPEDVPYGGVHKHLIDSGVDYAVLRPTWFTQNLKQNYLVSIKEHDHVFSATQDGKIPFVSTEDIAQAAFEALTAEKSPNKDILVFGPELLTYDEVANILTRVLGREITHRRLSVEDLAELYSKYGLSKEFANALAATDAKTAQGEAEALFRETPNDRKFVGKHTVFEYVEANKDKWIK